MVLTVNEVAKIMADFLSKHTKELECKTYEYEEKVIKEGKKEPKIYIVKDGVFRVTKLDIQNANATLGFLFKSDIVAPIVIDNNF